MKNEQNSLDAIKHFKTTKKKFYREIGRDNVKETPTIEELKSFWSVTRAKSPRNNDDDNTINKGRYAVKQKTPREREASSNN